MLLAIDVGNTNIVLGVYSDEKLLFTMRIASDKNRTSDELAVSIKSVLAFHNVDVSKIDDSIISSVVPEITNTLKTSISAIIGKEPMIVGPGLKTGINIVIDNPAQLGSDMLVDCVAVSVQYPLPAIIIDMGTATTFSALTKDLKMVGGAIVPGVKTSLNALSGKAAQLPFISIQDPGKAIGKNTIDSMQSGIVYGNAAMIDGMVERFEEELGEKCTIVATGGLSEEISKHTKRKVIYNGNLLIEGLIEIYKKNKNR